MCVGVGVGVGVVGVARSIVVYTASFQGFRWYSVTSVGLKAEISRFS